MTKERFMELAKQQNFLFENPESLWEHKPAELDDMPESTILKIFDPDLNNLADEMEVTEAPE